MQVIANESRNSNAGTNLLLIFVKAPSPGTVKTRLARSLGEHHAVELYKNFVFDVLDAAEKSNYPITICCEPAAKEGAIASWLGTMRHYEKQEGADLGEKMKAAFSRAFLAGSDAVLLVGSDIPELTASIIQSAFESLQDHDIVLGPSFDGGYYLIGFRKKSFMPQVFEGIHWSSNTVFQETMKVLAQARMRVSLLPLLRDLDTIEDLEQFFCRHANETTELTKTLSYLKKHKRLVVLGAKR